MGRTIIYKSFLQPVMKVKGMIVRNIESKINFIFVGALVKGKRDPLYAIQLVEGLLIKV
jgi:hypothetical protein